MREQTKSNIIYTLWGLSLFGTYLVAVWGSLFFSVICGAVSLLLLLVRKRMGLSTEPLPNAKAYLALCTVTVVAFGIWGYPPLVILCSFMGANVLVIMYAFDSGRKTITNRQDSI